MTKFSRIFILVSALTGLCACVTQNYQDGKTPVIENDANNNEIAMTRIQLGLGYLKMGNTSQAKLNLEKAKRFAPKLVQVHTAFAHYYETVGEAELAINAYEQALSISPEDADTLNNYGVFLCRQDRIDDAEKQFLKAIAVPSYILVAKSYENLALCQLKGQHFDKAEEYLEKAILHSPSSASILLQMVRLQYAKGEYKLAQEYLAKYEKATRRFTPTALALAFKVYEKQKNRRIAKNYAAMLVKMFPNSYEANQYILNELAKIEADELAQQYRDSLSAQSDTPSQGKKRVVVLKPKEHVEQKPSTLVQSENTKVVAKKPVKSTDSVTAATEKSPVPASNENKVATPAPGDGQTMMTIPIHVVEEGDSLFSISKKYNIHMKAIKRWNNIRKANVLRIGDVIYLGDPKKAAKS